MRRVNVVEKGERFININLKLELLMVKESLLISLDLKLKMKPMLLNNLPMKNILMEE